MLYRAHDALTISIPQTPFQSSSEIYNYLDSSLRQLVQSQPKCTSQPPAHVIRGEPDEAWQTTFGGSLVPTYKKGKGFVHPNRKT